MEAVGQGECSLYSEDTVTDEEGRFRLRGLLVRKPATPYLGPAGSLLTGRRHPGAESRSIVK